VRRNWIFVEEKLDTISIDKSKLQSLVLFNPYVVSEQPFGCNQLAQRREPSSKWDEVN